MGKHFNHGLKRGTKEYNKMVAICHRDKISNEEYINNIELYKERKKHKRSKHLEYVTGSHEYKKSVYLNTIYNITLNEYNNILLEQEHKCAICGIHQNELSTMLSVDHDHTTNKVRGLLCQHCNIGLGNFRDNPSNMISGYNYLIKYYNKSK